MKRIFHIDCELNYEVGERSLFVFNVGIPNDSHQTVLKETLDVRPVVAADEFSDVTALNRYFRFESAAGPLTVRYLATVEIQAPPVDSLAQEVPLSQLPGEVFPYLRASRYCEADKLFLLACREFGTLPRGYARVEAICRWIHDKITYQIGASSAATTARDVLANHAGVCRDFAHLAIALCRALNIPARFVTGYACYTDPPPDFHALFEAYLGGRWHLFDPSRLARLDEIVRIGTGLDASDVAFATFFGSAKLRRLSPLIELNRGPAGPHAQLVALQKPGSGILLAA